MLYITLTLLSGIVSGILSIFFRMQEINKKIILMHKQFFTQLALFALFAIVFGEFFSSIFIDLGFMKLGWLIIYILFSSASYYGVQVFFEYYTGNKLFATEDEVKAYLEILDEQNRR